MTTIFVVDDEFLVVEVLGFALEYESYTVVRVANGRKALEVIDRERSAPVITDWSRRSASG